MLGNMYVRYIWKRLTFQKALHMYNDFIIDRDKWKLCQHDFEIEK